jgi:hypothetical protein
MNYCVIHKQFYTEYCVYCGSPYIINTIPNFNWDWITNNNKKKDKKQKGRGNKLKSRK